MTTFKKGDRVKVEFEAVYKEPYGELSAWLDVGAGSNYLVPLRSLTLVEPEYEEGEMYVDAEGHYFAYFSGANHLYPWFAPGSMRGRAPGYPKRPLTKLVAEEKK
jgi:hypothetical protein